MLELDILMFPVSTESRRAPLLSPFVYGVEVATLMLRGMMGNIACDFWDPLECDGSYIAMANDGLS